MNSIRRIENINKAELNASPGGRALLKVKAVIKKSAPSDDSMRNNLNAFRSTEISYEIWKLRGNAEAFLRKILEVVALDHPVQLAVQTVLKNEPLS